MLRLVTSAPRSDASMTIPLPEHRRLGAPSRLPTLDALPDLPAPRLRRGFWQRLFGR